LIVGVDTSHSNGAILNASPHGFLYIVTHVVHVTPHLPAVATKQLTDVNAKWLGGPGVAEENVILRARRDGVSLIENTGTLYGGQALFALLAPAFRDHVPYRGRRVSGQLGQTGSVVAMHCTAKLRLSVAICKWLFSRQHFTGQYGKGIDVCGARRHCNAVGVLEGGV
jgi:hypothetical protein